MLHKVKSGECLNSIAEKYGVFPDTVWANGANSSIREARDPSVLMPGDTLIIPDKVIHQEACATDAKHSFRRKGVPALLRLQLTINDVPRANEPYCLIIDGKILEGTSDGDGKLEHPLLPNAKEGELRFIKDGVEEIFPLKFGTLDPIETESGVRGRLHALGYDNSLDLEALLREFQNEAGVEATGSIDATTKSKLKDIFGQ